MTAVPQTHHYGPHAPPHVSVMDPPASRRLRTRSKGAIVRAAGDFVHAPRTSSHADTRRSGCRPSHYRGGAHPSMAVPSQYTILLMAHRLRLPVCQP